MANVNRVHKRKCDNISDINSPPESKKTPSVTVPQKSAEDKSSVWNHLTGLFSNKSTTDSEKHNPQPICSSTPKKDELEEESTKDESMEDCAPNPLFSQVTGDMDQASLLNYLCMKMEQVHTNYVTIKEEISNLNKNCSDLNESVKFDLEEKREILESVNLVKEKSKINEENIEELKYENCVLKRENKQLHEKLLKIELDNHKKELVFKGLPDAKNQSMEYIHKTLVGLLNHIPEFRNSAHLTRIETIEQIGNFNERYSRDIKVTFASYGDVEMILKGKFNLPKGVYVDKLYPPEIESRRKILLPILKQAKQKYKGKCRLVDDTLEINSISYSVFPINNLSQLPADINPIEDSENKNDQAVSYFGANSPLSNFHPCYFKENGNEYHSSEQYIQARKAELANDDVNHHKIMSCKTPHEAKQLSKQIRIDDTMWKKNAEKIAYQACLLKFRQNEPLLTHLKSTMDRKIGEATLDKFWGIGISIRDFNCLTTESWCGENKMGKVLMRVRGDIK